MVKVCKFGGSSLASREQIDKVIDIIMADDNRRFVVVSAPGKRNKDDIKVTDMLIRAADDKPYASAVIDRFGDLLHEESGLVGSLSLELNRRLNQPRETVKEQERYLDGVKAFGEYAFARAFTLILNGKGIESEFFDTPDLGFKIHRRAKDNCPHPDCYCEIGRKLKRFSGRVAVIPGFYGHDSDGNLATLPRNGSDTSGAVIARAVNASEYENWTDEDGLRAANPTIVTNPRKINEITYREVRELAYIDFKLQSDSLVPLIQDNIPMRVCNTNNVAELGTFVVGNRLVSADESIVGVAAKKGYVSVNLSKMMMNEEEGFGNDVFGVFAEEKIPYEHTPTGIDTMSIIVKRAYLEKPGKLDELMRKLNDKRGPLEISLGDHMAMVAVAGLGIRRNPAGIYSRALGSLAKQGIQVYSTNMGASDMSFFIGVEEAKADDSVRAIYKEFFE